MSNPDPVWSWPEDHWRGIVRKVRAGRSMKPRKWKGGARAVVALSFNCPNETMELGAGTTSLARLSQGQYGARQGIPRILALLKAHGVPATFFMPAVAAMLSPAEAKAIAAAGHEIGLSGWIGETSAQLTAEAERDLMSGARDAVSGMVDFLCATRGLSAVEAYMLCSTCGDLRISEIVDMPNWVVSFYFPRVVFE